MSKEALERLLTFPLRSQIKIHFDLKERFFQVSVPIFSTKGEMPQSLRQYIESRKDKTFKPHNTSFQLEGETRILLTQQIPFTLEPPFRQQVDEFWQIAKQCHQMLSEMAIEEKYQASLHLGIKDC